MCIVEEDILKLYNRCFPYSLRTRAVCGELACREVVRSIRDAKSIGCLSYNESLRDDSMLSYAKVLLDDRGVEFTKENIEGIVSKLNCFPKNFKPSLAKSIYSHFCKDGYVCLDYSAGFGGRLLGCLCSGKSLQYIGFEPNTKTYEELKELGAVAKKVVRDSSSFRVINDISENICNYLDSDSVDFAFSCPPYYKYEEYCSESTQSTVKYPRYEDWLSGYVTETIRSIRSVLKKGGLFLVYIMNVTIDGVCYPLVDDWIRIAEESGFTLEDCSMVNKNFSIAGRSCLISFRK